MSVGYLYYHSRTPFLHWVGFNLLFDLELLVLLVQGFGYQPLDDGLKYDFLTTVTCTSYLKHIGIDNPVLEVLVDASPIMMNCLILAKLVLAIGLLVQFLNVAHTNQAQSCHWRLLYG